MCSNLTVSYLLFVCCRFIGAFKIVSGRPYIAGATDGVGTWGTYAEIYSIALTSSDNSAYVLDAGNNMIRKIIVQTSLCSTTQSSACNVAAGSQCIAFPAQLSSCSPYFIPGTITMPLNSTNSLTILSALQNTSLMDLVDFGIVNLNPWNWDDPLALAPMVAILMNAGDGRISNRSSEWNIQHVSYSYESSIAGVNITTSCVNFWTEPFPSIYNQTTSVLDEHGRNYYWLVCEVDQTIGSYVHLTATACFLPNVPFFPTVPSCVDLTSQDVFNFPAPIITPGTLGRISNPVAAPSAHLFSAGIASETIVFSGAFFASRAQSSSQSSNQSSNYPVSSNTVIAYGPIDTPEKYACIIDDARSSYNTITCSTSSSATGSLLHFEVYAAGLSTIGTDVYSTLTAPQLDNITSDACDYVPSIHGVMNCPTTGGFLVFITGGPFFAPFILIGVQSCDRLAVSLNEIIWYKSGFLFCLSVSFGFPPSVAVCAYLLLIGFSLILGAL